MKTSTVLIILLLGLQSFGQQFIKSADSIRRMRSIPAIAYIVFSSDSILQSGVSGVRKVKTRDSVSTSDRFHIGTNTFAFTSWLAAKMVESGKISWNTTFASIYPQFKARLLPEYKNIDLKGLLSNSTGLAAYSTIKDFQAMPFFESDIRTQRREFANWVLQQPTPGGAGKAKNIESLAGYAIAASMLEKVSGLSWEKMVEDYINKPLGIQARFGWPAKISAQQPLGHSSSYGSLTAESADTWLKPYPPIAAAVDINISIADYATFMQEHLKGLRGEPAYFSSKTFEVMHFGVLDYAFGWNNGVLGKDRLSFHASNFLIFSSYVELIPERNLGIIVLSNNGDSDGKSGVVNLGRIIRNYYLSR